MTFFTPLFKAIKNYRDGFHLASKHWQDYKNKLPLLPTFLQEVLIGIVLGDAGMQKRGNQAYVKFEQGYLQEAFLFHLFTLFSTYCFILTPGTRYELHGHRTGLVKSFWFKTFSFVSFTEIWNLFYRNGVKSIPSGLIMNHVTRVSFAYWIMCDGSLNGNSMILHTQSFTQAENIMMSNELNEKFGLHSVVIPHKKIYFVIKFPTTDRARIRELILPHMIPSIMYKVPKE